MRNRKYLLLFTLALAGAGRPAMAAVDDPLRPKMNKDASWLFGIWEKTSGEGGKEWLWFDSGDVVQVLDEKHQPKVKGSFKMEGKSIVVTSSDGSVTLRLESKGHGKLQGGGKTYEPRR